MPIILEYDDPREFLNTLGDVLAKYRPKVWTTESRKAYSDEMLAHYSRVNFEGQHRLQEKLARCAGRPFSRLADRPKADRRAA
jgi:hypothetical protein